MRESKENARPDAATSEQAAGADFAGHVPSNNYTMAHDGRQLRIADFLATGAENGITLRHLEKLTGIPGREIRRQIETERRAGALIISDNRNGYYLADDFSEAKRFARSMQHRAAEILKTAKAVERAAGC